MNEGEAERIARVYAGYAEARLGAVRWGTENRGNRAILEEREQVMRSLLRDHGMLPLGDRRVLEVGSGTGHVLAGMLELGAQPDRLVGVDLLPERVARAREAYPELAFSTGNAEELPFEDGTFDLVMLFVVFSSILDGSMRRAVASECVRVLKPGGAVLWYDFRYDNPQNPHVRGIRLREVRSLFQGLDRDVRRLTLVPQLARRLGPLTPALYPVLASIPPLRTYYMALLTKP